MLGGTASLNALAVYVPAAEAVLMALGVANVAAKVRDGAAVQQQQGGLVEALDWAPQPAAPV